MRTLLTKTAPQFDSLLRQAIHALESHRNAEAIQLLRQALGLKPFGAQAWFWLGRAHEEAGRLKEAAYCFHLATHCDLQHWTGRQALKRLGWYEDEGA
jgi:Flp pilus assembly protein TadD